MKTIIAGIVLALTAAGAANAATIVSEDFESGPGAFTLSGNVALATGATYNPCCGTPNDTSNTFVAFGGGNNPSGTLMSASFNTVLGSVYTVNFDYGALGNGSEALTFTVGGQSFTFNPVADNSLVTTFGAGSFTFIGIGGVTALDVASEGLPNVDAVLDNISISGAVPEPAAWGLMILGFGAVGGALRRARPTRVALTLA